MNDQPTVPKQPQTFSERFVERLRKLPRADKAILKRNAGRALAHARQAYGIFYRLYWAGEDQTDKPDQGDEEVLFLVATLYGLNPDPEMQQRRRQKPAARNFGGTMKALVRESISEESAKKRMTALLDCPFDLGQERSELAYRLRQCVKLAVSRDIGLNWPQLINDLKWWNHPEKTVQKRWASSFFAQVAAPADDDDNSEPNASLTTTPAITA